MERKYGKKNSVYNNPPLSAYMKKKLAERKPGEKTEEEIRNYGIHCKPKVKKREFNSTDQTLLDKRKADSNEKRRKSAIAHHDRVRDLEIKQTISKLVGSELEEIELEKKELSPEQKALLKEWDLEE